MQKQIVKNIAFLITIFLIAYNNGYSQDLQKLLSEGDSLFQNKRFTQSLHKYESIFNQGSYSPNMLLKMAYVSEALEKKPQTLFYLNSYFLATGNSNALAKMEKLAEEWGITGYENSTTDTLSVYLIKYKDYLLLSVSFIALIAFFIFITLYKARTINPKLAGLSFIMLLIPLLLLVNYEPLSNRGIVFKGNIPAMSGPSPASKMITRISEGEKVQITDHSKAWTQIDIDGKTGYIRNIYLRVLSK